MRTFGLVPENNPLYEGCDLAVLLLASATTASKALSFYNFIRKRRAADFVERTLGLVAFDAVKAMAVAASGFGNAFVMYVYGPCDLYGLILKNESRFVKNRRYATGQTLHVMGHGDV